MIIDAHTHIGFGGAIVADARDLLSSMKKARIDKALILAGALNECPTEKLIETIAPHKGTLYAVGSVSPKAIGYPKKDLLDRLDGWLADGAIVALKFYLGYEHFYPHEESLLGPYYELLEKHGRPAVFHTGDCYTEVGRAILKYAHPLEVDVLAARRPKLTIVMAHVGNPWTIDAAEVCYNKPNVYADCSGFVCGKFSAFERRHFVKAVRHFLKWTYSEDKLLFGTDWPISDQKDYLRVIDGLGLSGRAKKKLLSGNAERIFRLA